MRQVLGICVRSDNGSTPEDRRRILAETVQRARVLLEWSCPVSLDDVTESHWSDDRHISLLGWQNELADPIGSITWQRPDGHAWLLGYAGQGNTGQEVLDADDLLASTDTWSGCFGVLRARADRIEAVTDATRSTQVYTVETPTVRMIGTRSVQLHLLAQAEMQATNDPLPRWNPLGMRQLAAAGYVVSNHTAFADVISAPIASQTVLLPDQLVVRATDVEVAPVEPRDATAWSQTVDSVAEALIGAFDPIPATSLRVGITGGRDSRMIVSALSHRPDRDLSLFTSGHPDTPDVIIGTQVAAALGLPHEVVPSPGTRADG